MSGTDELFADYPQLTAGRIGWGTLRNILEWEQRHGIAQTTQTTLDEMREEGYSAARAGLELGLIDYGQASGEIE